MTKRQLKKLRADVALFNARWVERGGKLTAYHCGHCHQSIETLRPKKRDVGSKGFWDSCATCTNCGLLNFVQVFPSGKTTARPMRTDLVVQTVDVRKLTIGKKA